MSAPLVAEILAALNLVQLFFWGYQVHTLVNKLMSKNFAEYKLIQNGPPKITEVPLEENEFEESEILGELNGMFASAKGEAS